MASQNAQNERHELRRIWWDLVHFFPFVFFSLCFHFRLNFKRTLIGYGRCRSPEPQKLSIHLSRLQLMCIVHWNNQLYAFQMPHATPSKWILRLCRLLINRLCRSISTGVQITESEQQGREGQRYHWSKSIDLPSLGPQIGEHQKRAAAKRRENETAQQNDGVSTPLSYCWLIAKNARKTDITHC